MKAKSSKSYKFLYLFALAVLVVGTFVLTLLPLPTGKTGETQKIFSQRQRVTSSQLPVIEDIATFPTVSAQGVIAVDLDSAVVLYEKNPDLKLLPASTTKILTALVALEHYPLDQVITVTRNNVVGQKMRLVVGEQITVRSLIEGLLIFSANDAAEVLADNYPGGYDAFIAEMNQKAQALHMNNSHFVNPTGLDAPNHYSTVRDLVRLSQVAMKHSLFAEIVATKTKTVSSVDKKFIHPMRNINELLGTVEGVVGVKTGWTEGARENLVTYIVRDNHHILIALLGSQDRFGETTQLVDWIFGNFAWHEVKYEGTEN